MSICERKSSTEVRLIHTGQMSSKNFIILWKNNRYTNNRPFQERRAIACGHAHTHTEAFRSVSNCMCKSNFWLHLFYYKIVCLWSTYMPILMLSLNKGLSLIIKLKFWSQVFWFWKVLTLHRNKKGFLLSPVYKHLKSVFAHMGCICI